MITKTKAATLLALIDETPRCAAVLTDLMNKTLIEQQRQGDAEVTTKIVGAMLSSFCTHQKVLFNTVGRARHYYIPADGVPAYRLVPTPDPAAPVVNGWLASARAAVDRLGVLGWTLA